MRKGEKKMEVRQILVVKVYRKKDPQEIRDRQTGRVSGVYYPVILDDGDNTIDMTVPEDVYNEIRFDYRFRRDGQAIKPKIEGLMFELPNNWRGDFLSKFNELVSSSVYTPAKPAANTEKTTANTEKPAANK